jgi:aminoglycoside phosphotransferase (APT) family kinase protein
MTGPADTADLAARLAAVVDARAVDDLRQLSGGASRETWSFAAVDSSGERRSLILQRQRPGSERDITVEAGVVRAAGAAGVPVAGVVAASADPDVLGAPFMVVTAVRGETIARRILRDDEFVAARVALPSQLGRALATLHAVDPAAVDGLEAPDQVAQYREVLDTVAQPHPAFELGFRWLEAHRPPPGPAAVVHGDFRLGNLIVDRSGLAAVVDWELAHVGDPMEDLGWLCVKAWRFGSPQPVAGVGSYAELFAAYGVASGRPVDAEVVRWWEVLGTLKWGIMCIMQASAHLTGTVRSHELAAIGRRVCENEHDLLLLLS